MDKKIVHVGIGYTIDNKRQYLEERCARALAIGNEEEANRYLELLGTTNSNNNNNKVKKFGGFRNGKRK